MVRKAVGLEGMVRRIEWNVEVQKEMMGLFEKTQKGFKVKFVKVGAQPHTLVDITSKFSNLSNFSLPLLIEELAKILGKE